ncbi:MAG: ABC transporter substrate-binding protein [Rhodocyclaceae bacterium]|jgi:branched-chain amino acid transport system substrate-binding protein|nr:Leu/Ile/Val-binding protein [Rhodocyclaceae bacterium]MBZ0102197.1 ABC transporter substrate-binding protein [Thermoanaerobaculia bacterium]MCC6878381.1 ABC transporter substrate-binding protein [Rhodocyclaceae bacterium]MCL4682069.1 ABC transporter substrate-binding protein [Rhodocyclaceae bacterium]
MRLTRLLALAACFLGMAAPAAEPIRIGVSGPFTGGSSPMGLSMRDGIRIAADEINAAGGLLGRPVQLVERDDEARNERGAQVAQELIRKERIVAAVGIVNTGVALASQRHYQEARIPVITAVATGSVVTRQFLPPQHPDNFVFRMSANDTIQAAMIVEEAVERRHFRRLAILADSTNYGQLGRDDLLRVLEKKGIRPVAVEQFHIRDIDMSRQLLRARQAGAETLLLYGIGPELAQIANGAAKLGWQVPIIGGWPLSMSNFIDSAGPNGEGATMPQTFIQEADTPKRAAFIAAWQKRARSERMPSPSAAAQGYDGMHLLAAAIRQAGTTHGSRVREALEDLKEKVEGVIMTYERPFSRSDHETIDSPGQVVMGEVRGGRVVRAHDDNNRKKAAK